MSVALTVVLSVSSRSVTDIATTTYEEDALRAFSAAEAGVEESLITQIGSGGSVQIDPSVDPGLTYTSEVTSLSTEDEHHYQKKLNPNEVATFWFVDRDSNGFTCGTGNCTTAPSLEFCWGEPGTPSDQSYTPAIQILLFYDDFGLPPNTPKAIDSPNNYEDVAVKEYAFDPNLLRGNNFDPADVGVCWDADYAFSANFNIASPLPPACPSTQGCLLMAGVRMLYNDGPSGQQHKVALRVGGAGFLPAQGIEIESTGEAGESTRKVRVVQSYPEPLHGFWGAVYGESDL
jgi:hypothetical protein